MLKPLSETELQDLKAKPAETASHLVSEKDDADSVLEKILEGVSEDELADEKENESAEVSSEPWLDSDTKSFLISFGVHLVFLVALAAIPLAGAINEKVSMILTSTPVEATPEDFRLVDQVAFADEASSEVGANSNGDSGMAMSLAPVVADVSEVPMPEFEIATEVVNFEVASQIKEAVGLTESKTVTKGLTGVSATGTDGAVDRLTYEILQAMEERPTLVVWLFDQSGSLNRRRQEIRDRFDRIYEELGLLKQQLKRKERNSEEPLLSSVIAYGESVNLLTKDPTADVAEIRSVIDSIQVDNSGVEKVFSALYLAADKYKSYRSTRGGKDPERNVLLVVVTDERGDDPEGLEATIKVCRQHAMPVYVVGVPAPFGREFAYLKYVDPDPKFDQSPQWAQVDQGPESIAPERIQLGFEENAYEEPIMDSGFGPYALSRLCYETGGIFFTVHPNRRFNHHISGGETDAFASHLEYFFDPERMVRYRPEYVTRDEYMKRIKESPMRQALLTASQLSRVGELQSPRIRFVKMDEAVFANELTLAQQAAARLEPKLNQLVEILNAGMQYRSKETSPRWLAGYDLSMGIALAHQVRTEGYNAMLAKAKRGMKFEDDKNNTWILRPDDEISVGSKAEKEAKLARELLERVASEHEGTPWGLLATRELKTPIGWKWVEEFTPIPKPKAVAAAAANNNPPPPPQNDQAQMLPPPPPRRPIPKL